MRAIIEAIRSFLTMQTIKLHLSSGGKKEQKEWFQMKVSAEAQQIEIGLSDQWNLIVCGLHQTRRKRQHID